MVAKHKYSKDHVKRKLRKQVKSQSLLSLGRLGSPHLLMQFSGSICSTLRYKELSGPDRSVSVPLLEQGSLATLLV